MDIKTLEKDKTFMGIGPVPKTVEASTTFVKQITAITLSTIFYAKGFFSEDDYTVLKADGIPITIIKATKRCPGATRAVKWLEGAFDALQLKYLKQMFLEITDGSQNLLEMYTLRYTYEDDSTTCTVEHGGKSMRASLLNTQAAIRSLLRNLMILSSSHGTLPKTASCHMKLQYNDDTPVDYEPPGFRPLGDEPPPAFIGRPESWRIGEVSTRFHTLIISSKVVESNLSVGSPTKSGKESENLSTNPHNNKAPDGEILKAQGKALYPVNCVCGVKEVGAGIMINCNKCSSSQHGACYKMVSVEEIPHQHTCMDCRSSQVTSDVEFHTTPGEMSRDNCLYRCALVVCLKHSRLTVANLAQELHVDHRKALTLMRRLLRDAALHKPATHGPSLDAPNQIFLVDVPRIKFELIPQHFKISQPCTSEKVITMHTSEQMQSEDGENSRHRKKRTLSDQKTTDSLPEIQRKNLGPRHGKLRRK